jgi:sulfide:quinone oxidoreductase
MARHVVIAGAGVAALEASSALTALAGDRITLTLIAPESEFVFRPLGPHRAFGHTAPPSVPLVDLADAIGAEVISDTLAWVDREGQCVHTKSGREISYDIVLLAVGAVCRARYPEAITVCDTAAEELAELVDDIRAGGVTGLAFIVPKRMAWPLPLYEVALMSATLAAEHELELTLVTAERRPLQIFGRRASDQLLALLTERRIEVVTNARCEVPERGRVLILADHHPAGRQLSVDRVVALPELLGPHVRGLPCADNGFIPVDRFCRVPTTADVYAAGDATDYPVKHGGIAAQQADVAARSIAAAAGAAVVPRPFHPTIEGLLLTGGEPRYLSARLTGGEPFGSRLSTPLAETAPPKIAGHYLSDLLQKVDS